MRHAAADDVDAAGVQDPRGNQVEHVLGVPHVHGVTGVGGPLIANDDVDVARQEVDHLTFALVAPLGTENAECGHGRGRERAGSAEGSRVHKRSILAARANADKGNRSALDASRASQSSVDP